MPVATEKFIFFPGDASRPSREGIRTLRDGRQVTDPDVLIRTPEFKEHLREIKATIDDYVATTTDDPSEDG